MTKKQRFEHFKQDLDTHLQEYLHDTWHNADYNAFVNETVDEIRREFKEVVRLEWSESDIQIHDILYPDSKPISWEEDWRSDQELQKQKANKPPAMPNGVH